jgi:hypothetical protein
MPVHWSGIGRRYGRGPRAGGGLVRHRAVVVRRWYVVRFAGCRGPDDPREQLIRDPSGSVSQSWPDREQAHPAEQAQRVTPGPVVHGQARLGHGPGDIAGECRQRVIVRQAAPVDADQPGDRLREFRGLGCSGPRSG